MHVDDVAVYETTFKPSVVREKLTDTTDEKVNNAVRENLVQVAAVAGICNAAAFSYSQDEQGITHVEVIGDATGIIPVISETRSLLIVSQMLLCWRFAIMCLL